MSGVDAVDVAFDVAVGGVGVSACGFAEVVAAVVASLTSFLIASSLFAKKSSRDE